MSKADFDQLRTLVNDTKSDVSQMKATVMEMSLSLPRMMNDDSKTADNIPNRTTVEVEIHREEGKAQDISVSSIDEQLPNTEDELAHNMENISKPVNSEDQLN